MKRNETITGTYGTRLFMSPEILKKEEYNHLTDIWSAGILFYEMLTGFVPFVAHSKQEILEAMKKGYIRIPVSLNLSYDCVDFINLCLQADWQEDRATAAELLEHPFLT